MATVSVTRTVNAPIDQVWSSWDDFGAIARFNPNLKGSHLINSSLASGLGAMRQCDMADGKNYVREKVIEYRPHQKLVIDIYESSMPLKKAVASFDFKTRGQKTDVTMTIDFTPKFGVLGQLMVPLMKPQLRKMQDALLAGNADYVERGIEVQVAA
ncbi:SRPBCC family protein [uncultured Litoreibacter sp.]|uniref:SRPBCC family protein n=1 Tax=uncultured Litoreibacter sp. TaxID=1392394 RepID=UPI00261C4FF9|nr:SRPBCC family protein [uncultured Litoreibacter sp.]